MIGADDATFTPAFDNLGQAPTVNVTAAVTDLDPGTPGIQVLEGTTTPGAFFSFITAMFMAYRPIKSVASLNTHDMPTFLAQCRRSFRRRISPREAR